MSQSPEPLGDSTPGLERLLRAVLRVQFESLVGRSITRSRSDHSPAFILEELLGVGGEGAVFAALQTSVDRRVAIKLPLGICAEEGKAWREEQVARWKEAGSVRGMVRLFDAYDSLLLGVDPESSTVCSFMAFEFVYGQTLLDAARGREQSERLWLLQSLADVLAKLHAEGWVHGDLKESNVLVDDHGRCTLIDYGMLFRSGFDPPAENRSFGTPGCKPPEQSSSGSGPLCCRADVYAFGRILRRLLSEDVAQGSRHSLIHAGACAVESKCCSHDALARYPDAEAVRQELEYLTRGLPPLVSLGRFPTSDAVCIDLDLVLRLREEDCAGKCLFPVWHGIDAADEGRCVAQLNALAEHYSECVPSIEYLRHEYAPSAGRHYEASVDLDFRAIRPEVVDGLIEVDHRRGEAPAAFRARLTRAWTNYLVACWKRSPRELAAAILTLPEQFLSETGTETRKLVLANIFTGFRSFA